MGIELKTSSVAVALKTTRLPRQLVEIHYMKKFHIEHQFRRKTDALIKMTKLDISTSLPLLIHENQNLSVKCI